MKTRRFLWQWFVLILLAASIAGCATKPPVVEPTPQPSPQPTPKPTPTSPAAPGDPSPSTLQAGATGLAPSGYEQYRQIGFAISFGDRESVKTWTLSIRKDNKAVKTLSGNATDLPESLSWDGRNDSGGLAEEGNYIARLEIDYGDKFKPAKVDSKTFLLALTPPTVKFSPNPALFPSGPGGVAGPASVSITVIPALAAPQGWTLEISDDSGQPVKSLSGSLSTKEASWDGKTEQGSLVELNRDYPALLTVKDEYGNAGTFEGKFSIGDMPGAENSSIAADRSGFSPVTTIAKNTIDLLLTVGSKSDALSWKVQILSPSKTEIRTWSGGPTDAPDSLRWDGIDDRGKAADQGAYYATLSVDYGKVYKPAFVRSNPFSLVTSAPTGEIVVDPRSVALATLSPGSPVTFTVLAKSTYAFIATWTLSVLDSDARELAHWEANWPNSRVTWDGKTLDGSSLKPDSVYAVVAKVVDDYGNVGTLEGRLGIETLVEPKEPTAIKALAAGFGPLGDTGQTGMDFDISIGNSDSLVSWKVDLLDEGGTIQKTFTGDTYEQKLSWDGKIDNGAWAAEGKYRARLKVDYGVAFAPITVESARFALALSPPTGAITLTTDLFSPDGTGASDTVGIYITGTSKAARITQWSATVYDPEGKPFISWKGGWPVAGFAWDGIGSSGDLVESAEEYPIVLTLRDEFGNVGEVKKTMATDILVIKMAGGYRIRVWNIVFKPYTADFMSVPEEQATLNVATLDHLAKKLAKFPKYRIKLEGHAVMIFWDNPVKGEIEQREVLLPLSQDRADAIKSALVDRGLPTERMETSGVGALDPIVPDSDADNRWKNRRVEFYILR
jgi:flagellar hook assembly protein FlgD